MSIFKLAPITVHDIGYVMAFLVLIISFYVHTNNRLSYLEVGAAQHKLDVKGDLIEFRGDLDKDILRLDTKLDEIYAHLLNN